jgi:Leucine-rich repeat (LRR) protein
MANQLNPIHIQFQPASLLKQTTSFIITRDLQYSQNINNQVSSLVNNAFERVWLDLKSSPQDFSLEHVMSNIENSSVEDILERNMSVLFKKLAEKFEAKRIFGSHIPVDISSYARLQRLWEDEALQKIWDLCLIPQLLLFNHGPMPTSLDEIKAWMKDPANAAQLNSIQTLSAKWLELKAIPPEISALTGLRCCFLQNNQISSIPDSLGSLTQLQWLYLQNNEISRIPNSLSNLSQLEGLNLENNQIRGILNSLGNLSQLQWLDLENNQIRSIPDSLGSLSQLKSLALAGNQIRSIPDSLGNLSQLQWLSFAGNQISSVPGWLRELPQLEWLSLNNQVSN